MTTTTVASPTIDYLAIAEELEPGEVRVFRNVAWEDYEWLHEQWPLDSQPVRVSYHEGTMEIMSTSALHETYAHFVDGMIRLLSLRLRIDIRFFGSATIKKSRRRKGLEPDACFYVQTVPQLGNRLKLDFAVDPPPDVALEVDIYHGSIPKLPIYAGLGIPEIWRYDGRTVTMFLLQQDHYVEAAASRALPMLTPEVLTRFLKQMQEENEFQAMIAFEDWISTARGTDPAHHPSHQ
ncbi:MAG TPA: Uma2 family endonuclease [Blastocatellia bacterium]|nr:Uma2 family endonuclease [Blastocatellia bacterium]HMV86897.1 Uma2 family endonuclease [Blastocatellia bacterium]HMX28680.1 Uma2 family endonuclease [Blastocatellia bacterium]HMZ18804.1 Uma2 family endonuclease [Blastocatellia bacterium]HNG29829.1 Uma2 family endonuclease [Blastocatellia bacterium]